jgi:septal ring factor EnvC (AmiA/AmiB activator)
VRRASAVAIAIALALSARANAGDDVRDEPHAEPARDHAKTHDKTDAATGDARTTLADQLAAEAQAIDKTLATVADKLHAADLVRARRLRAAYRILHAPLASDASNADRMISARRRAAARLLLDRDATERGLLAGEADRLRAAQTRTADATSQLPTITLPTDLSWPASGKVTRHFGVFEHERSHATLSRRGLDLDVADHASAFAVADGVVRYAGPIRGLEHGVIVDHGDFLTIVAKLGELSIPVGTHVARGDRLGRAARHRVYVEVRIEVGAGGLPIDPEPLFSH